MTENGRVVLTVPARGEYARVVRLCAAELASRAGMNIDDVDDIKLAVEEAFVFAAEHMTNGEMTFTFHLGPKGLDLLVGPLPEDCAHDEGGDAGERYARFILEAVCDEFEVLTRDGACFLRLVKKTV
jgi:serine/threonine-protein kinase RsbW